MNVYRTVNKKRYKCQKIKFKIIVICYNHQMKTQIDTQPKQEHKKVIQSKKNYEFIWRGVFLFISIVSAFLINKIYIYQTSEYFVTIKKGNLGQLVYYGVPFGILFILSEAIIHYLFNGKCEKYYINHDKYKTEQARKKRSYTLVKWAYSLTYYAISSIAGYLLVQETSFMPTWLGGAGYCTDVTRYLSTFEQANLGMKVFYVLQFGKHLGRFFQHVFLRSEGNFYEYALHHGLSTFLIFFSYLTNMWLIGIFVLLIHDVSDFFLILARGYRDYKNMSKKLLKFFYVMAGISWIFCRIFLLSCCCVYSSISSVYEFLFDPQNYAKIVTEVLFVPGMFMAFMLSALQILQIFWTYYIVSSFIQVNVSEKIAKHTYD